MAKETITSNGIEYVQKKSVAGKQKYIICVDNRGLTFVGDCDLSSNDEFITIYNAKCIIRWGTTKHIAEIVSGPLEKTKLGQKADVIVRRENIIFAYQAGSGWVHEE